MGGSCYGDSREEVDLEKRTGYDAEQFPRGAQHGQKQSCPDISGPALTLRHSTRTSSSPRSRGPGAAQTSAGRVQLSVVLLMVGPETKGQEGICRDQRVKHCGCVTPCPAKCVRAPVVRLKVFLKLQIVFYRVYILYRRWWGR